MMLTARRQGLKALGIALAAAGTVAAAPKGSPEGSEIPAGAHTLAALTQRLAPLPLRPLDVLGFPEAAKESACFALLAHEFLRGTPTNLPSVTGARHPVLLGELTP